MSIFDYALEHLFSYTAELEPPEMIGPVPEGIRVNFYVTGEDPFEGIGTAADHIPGGGGLARTEAPARPSLPRWIRREDAVRSGGSLHDE